MAKSTKKEASVAELEQQLEAAVSNLAASEQSLAAAESAFDEEVTPATTEALTKARDHRSLQLDLHARATRLLDAAKAAEKEAARAALRDRLSELEGEFHPSYVEQLVAPIDLEEVMALEKVAEIRLKRRVMERDFDAKRSEIVRLRERLGLPSERGTVMDPATGKTSSTDPIPSVPSRITNPDRVMDLIEERLRSRESSALSVQLRALAPNHAAYRVR